MKIISGAGNSMELSGRQWLSIKAALEEISKVDQDNYYHDIEFLPAISTNYGKIDVAMDEHGVGYGGSVTVTLEGDIRYPYGGTEQEMKDGIVADFTDWAWQDNKACKEAVDEISQNVHGRDRSLTHSTKVDSLAVIAPRMIRVRLVFVANIESNETMPEYRQRGDEERASIREE